MPCCVVRKSVSLLKHKELPNSWSQSHWSGNRNLSEYRACVSEFCPTVFENIMPVLKIYRYIYLEPFHSKVSARFVQKKYGYMCYIVAEINTSRKQKVSLKM